MDIMVTCLPAGSTRTRIIDWVSTWSALNFESSSEPSNSTVKGAPGEAAGVGGTFRPGLLLGGTTTVWPVWHTPATPPPREERMQRRPPSPTTVGKTGSG